MSPVVEQLVSGHGRIEGLPDIRERKVLTSNACVQMALLFESFEENELTRRPEGSIDNYYEDNSYYTETTPFFEDDAGGRLAIQKYFLEGFTRERGSGILGALGIRREVVPFTHVLHYAVVADAGNEEVREFVRVSAKGSPFKNDFLSYAIEDPWRDAVSGSAGTLEKDRQVAQLLNDMTEARSNGNLSLTRQVAAEAITNKK